MGIRCRVACLILVCLIVGCKKKSDQTTIQIDVAKLKELELAERMYEDVKLEEASKIKKLKEQEERLKAVEALERAEQLQREAEQKQAEKDKKRQLELEKRAAKRRALDEEIKSLASTDSKFGRAADIGVAGSFKTQELSIKNEYEANLRGAVNNARQAILIVVDNHRVSLVEELKAARDELSAIETVLDAHQKGTLSAEQKNAMLNSYQRQQTTEVDEASKLLWQ